MKTLIRNVKLFDGTAVAAKPMDVLFDETGILAVAETGAEAPAADTVVDGSGKTLTPGLIDGHVHLGAKGMEGPSDPRSYTEAGARIAHQMQDIRRYGITTVRNCGTGGNADLFVRDMIRSGEIDGGRIVGCGKGICITGGHGWSMSIETDTVDETRKAARLQLREGADFVKLMATGGMGTKGSVPNAPQLTEAQMRAAVEEAASVGKFTAAHCTGLVGAMNAIRAGVHIIEHAQLDEPTAEAMAKSGAAWCPTIVTRYRILHTTDPNYQWMRKKADPGDLVRKQKALMLCKQYGIPVIAGTDAGPNLMVPLGDSLWTELGIYQEYGMTAPEVLHSCTAGAARVLKIDEVTGAVCPGLAADLALFEGDPTADITAVNTVCQVWQNGVQKYVKV